MIEKNDPSMTDKDHEPLPGVDSNAFIDAIKEVDPIAWQMWRDERGWYLPGDCKYALQVWLYDDHAEVSPHGYGSNQGLKAKTPDELKECCRIWWRNRCL